MLPNGSFASPAFKLGDELAYCAGETLCRVVEVEDRGPDGCHYKLEGVHSLFRWAGHQADLIQLFAFPPPAPIVDPRFAVPVTQSPTPPDAVKFPSVKPGYVPPACTVNMNGSVAIRQIIDIGGSLHAVDHTGRLWQMVNEWDGGTEPIRLRQRDVLIDTREEAK